MQDSGYAGTRPVTAVWRILTVPVLLYTETTCLSAVFFLIIDQTVAVPGSTTIVGSVDLKSYALSIVFHGVLGLLIFALANGVPSTWGGIPGFAVKLAVGIARTGMARMTCFVLAAEVLLRTTGVLPAFIAAYACFWVPLWVYGRRERAKAMPYKEGFPVIMCGEARKQNDSRLDEGAEAT